MTDAVVTPKEELLNRLRRVEGKRAVVDRILDRGCVIDAFVRVTLVGIELLAIEARIVIASVDTWLKYAEAVGLTTTFDQMAEITA